MNTKQDETAPRKQNAGEVSLTISHLSGSRIGEVESFSRESILIGRGRHNDVSMDSFLDPTVSTQHAEIRWEMKAWVLYDMGSLNGSFVNGHRVRRVELRNGDEISLGRAGPRLAFEGSSQGVTQSQATQSGDNDPDTLTENPLPDLGAIMASDQLPDDGAKLKAATVPLSWMIAAMVVALAVILVLVVR